MTIRTNLGTWKVLVVDDSEDFLRAACLWLESLPDLEVMATARDGLGAVELVRSLKPDLVVMDAVMPSMDGFEATRRIKERGDAPKIVVVSLHDSRATRDAAWVSGADGFVAKSELTAALLPLIRKLRAGVAEGPEDGPRAGATGAEAPSPLAAKTAPPSRKTVDPPEREALESARPGSGFSFKYAWWRWLPPSSEERKEGK